MKKEDFVKILEVLKDTDIIGEYYILKNENAIYISTINEYGEEDYNYTYYFNESDMLIHPKIIEIKEEIKKLEKEKQKCEETLETLLILYS